MAHWIHTPERLGRYTALYDQGVITRTELLYFFIDCVAMSPADVAVFFERLPSEFAVDIRKFAETPDDEWVSSFYPRGLADYDTENTSYTVPMTSFEPDKYALASLRALQSLKLA